MRFYPVQQRWRRIKPHIQNPEVQRVLVRDFNRFTYGRWRKSFVPGMKPTDFESCDWRCDRSRGRQPEFWDYVKHAGCHWLVNFNRRLAELAEPRRKWRIVSSLEHSTVYDGQETLFDFNFSALGVDPDEAWRLASRHGKALAVGRDLVCHLAPFWKTEVRPTIKARTKEPML